MDTVKRLRNERLAPSQLCQEAADEIERLTFNWDECKLRNAELVKEIERLQRDDALEGAYDSLREHMQMVKERDAEIERLRAALQEIALFPSGEGAIARAALEDE